MNEQKKYNGWTNYETWNYALWLDNEQHSQEYWAQRAQEVYDESEADSTFSRKERAALALEEEIKDGAEEFAADNMDNQSNWLADAVNAYLGSVNWYEIAEHYLAEVEEEEATE